MRRDTLIKAVLIATFALLTASPAYAEEFFARLNGFQEIGPLGAGETGAIRSNGTGTLHLSLDANGKTAAYTLTVSDVGQTPPTTGTITQAHIHFGKRHVAGGIIVFLCSNLANPPSGTPACPQNSGTVSGTLTPASVIGPAAQNIAAGDFTALVDALRSNTAYANVHTTGFPAGEIRGQVRRGQGDRDDHDDKGHGH